MATIRERLQSQKQIEKEAAARRRRVSPEQRATNGYGAQRQHDAEVVMTKQLAHVVNWWIKSHNADHPNKMVDMGGAEAGFSAHQYIVEMTQKLDLIGNGVSYRRLWAILNVEFETTSVAMADLILAAIERTDALTNGEIPVVPNPKWSQERWVRYMQARGCEPE